MQGESQSKRDLRGKTERPLGLASREGRVGELRELNEDLLVIPRNGGRPPLQVGPTCPDPGGRPHDAATLREVLAEAVDRRVGRSLNFREVRVGEVGAGIPGGAPLGREPDGVRLPPHLPGLAPEACAGQVVHEDKEDRWRPPEHPAGDRVYEGDVPAWGCRVLSWHPSRSLPGHNIAIAFSGPRLHPFTPRRTRGGAERARPSWTGPADLARCAASPVSTLSAPPCPQDSTIIMRAPLRPRQRGRGVVWACLRGTWRASDRSPVRSYARGSVSAAWKRGGLPRTPLRGQALSGETGGWPG